MPTLAGAAGIISDDFYDAGTYGAWPNPTWVETDTPGMLALSYEGTTDRLWTLSLTNNNNDYFSDPTPIGDWTAPYVVQTAGTFTTADFTIQTKITAQPFTTLYDDCGIMVRWSTGIFCCGVYRSSATEKMAYRDGTGSTFAETTLGTGTVIPLWLQIRRVGNNFSGWYSLNGTSFTQISTAIGLGAITPNGAGFYAGCTHTAGSPVNAAKFDYLMEMTSGDFIAAEDTGTTGGAATRRIFIIS